MSDEKELKLQCLRLADGDVERAREMLAFVQGGMDEQLKEMFNKGEQYGRAHTARPIPYHSPVGGSIEEWKADVRKTDLYRQGDTVFIAVNEGDLFMTNMVRTHYVEGISSPPTPNETLEASPAAEIADGFMPWNCEAEWPIEPGDGRVVEVQFRLGGFSLGLAGDFEWDERIVAYRIVDPTPEPVFLTQTQAAFDQKPEELDEPAEEPGGHAHVAGADSEARMFAHGITIKDASQHQEPSLIEKLFGGKKLVGAE